MSEKTHSYQVKLEWKGNTGTGQQPATIPQQAKSFTVNINNMGVNTPINTTTEADARALIGFLQSSKLSSGL